MRSSILKQVRIGMLFLVLLLVLGLSSTSQASSTGFAGGIPWQVGDVIICFGTTADPVGGTCNVLRIVNNSPVLLDQFSDGLLGETKGVTLDNTLHAVVTDNGTGNDGSNVVVYTIASLNPDTTPASVIAHTVLPNTPFNASGGPGSGNAQAVVVNKIGHIFVGNAGTTAAASIVELNPGGSPANTFSVPPACIDPGGQFTSMDLSTDGNTLYFTSGGTTVQRLSLSPLPTFNCATPVANLATSGPTRAMPAVTLFDIRVIPPGALSAISGIQQIAASPAGATESGTTATITTSAAHGFTAGETVVVAGVGVLGYNGSFTVLSVPTATTFTYMAPGLPNTLAASGGGTVRGTCNGVACPTGESLLVVAKGLTAFDNDADAGIEPNGLSDPGLGIVAATESTTTASITGATESGTTVTITTSAAHGFLVGETVVVAGVTENGYNGTFTVSSVTATTFTYTDSSFSNLPASGGGTATVALATITTSAAHGFAVGNTVTVAGVGVSGYNGTFTVFAVPSTTTFTYSDSSSGLANSSGGTVNGPTTGDDLLIDVCTGTTPGTTPPHSCALLLNPATGTILTRYQTSQTSLEAMTLDPLVTDCTGGCSAWQVTHAYALGTTILDPALHVQKVTIAGTSGGAQPAFNDSGGNTPADGTVTWSDQGPTSVSNFLLGDSVLPNFYRVNFGSGHVTGPFTANPSTTATTNSPCATCSTVGGIQSLRIYGGQGANQDLTKLASGSLTSTTNFSSFVQFPLPVQTPPNQTDTNALTVTLAGTGLNNNSSVPFALYASLVSNAAPTNDGGNNSGRTDVNARDITGATFGTPPPCQPTTSDFTKCIAWKIDIGTGMLGGPANTALFTKIDGPANPVSPGAGITAGIDNGTHVFLDEHYDVTTFTGQFDPGGGTCQPICKTFTSVWSLQEVATAFTSGAGGGGNASGCFYVIGGKTIQPGSLPANNVFRSNRSTLPIEFQCPNVPFNTFSITMNNPPGPPLISILTSGTTVGGVKSAPVALTLTTTNAKAPYRFNGTSYIFNWSPIVGTYDICTFDPTNTIQPFCAGITVK